MTVIYNRPAAREQETYCNAIIKQTPAILTDFKNINILNDNRSSSKQSFQNPRQTTIYTILMKKSGRQDSRVNEIFKVFNDLVEISPVQPRPKFLLILLDDDWLDEELKTLLKYVWSLKFLDFTIVKSNGNNGTFFMNYNPFARSFFKSSRKVFPDKLIDVKKYPLTIDGP